MKVLVTGAAGFIGSALLEELIYLGFDVKAIDCFLKDSYDSRVKIARARSLQERLNIKIEEIDLRTDDLNPVLQDVEVVLNLAAMPGLIKSWSDFQLYVDCNLIAVDRMFNCKSFKPEKFIQASTSSVYGKFAVGDENSPCVPFSPYGVSKLAAENLIKAHSLNFGIDFTILRYFSVYGPNQRPDMAYAKFCDAILRGNEITIYGDGSAVRTNTYISDCVAGTVKAITNPQENFTVNLCGSQEITVLEALEVISDELKIKPIVKFAEKRPGDQETTRGDNALAQKILGFQEAVLVQDGLRFQARESLKSFLRNA